MDRISLPYKIGCEGKNGLYRSYFQIEENYTILHSATRVHIKFINFVYMTKFKFVGIIN